MVTQNLDPTNGAGDPRSMAMISSSRTGRRFLMMMEQFNRDQERCFENLLTLKSSPSVELDISKCNQDFETPADFIRHFNNICSINGYTFDDVKICMLTSCFTGGSIQQMW